MPLSRVLIADDDPLLSAILEHKLSAAGYLVSCVENGREALKELAARPPAIVVLDAMMPVMDGFETLRRIKADQALRDIEVVMLTALKRENDVVTALRLGAADYLAKPFNPDELIARLARLDRSVRAGA